MITIKQGSGSRLTPDGVKLLEFFLSHPGKMITASMAVECGACNSEKTFVRHVKHIQKSLSKLQRPQFENNGVGRYSWNGSPVEITDDETRLESKSLSLYTRSLDEVAAILGISRENVRLTEINALKKLSKQPKLRKAWDEIVAHHKPVHYDPFHEIWLFNVAENITYAPVDDDEDQEDESP